MIGIALYPDKTTFKEDVAYLKRAQRYGYQKVFMIFKILRNLFVD